MARRRPNRINRPVAGRVDKALPAQLAQSPGGQVRSMEQVMGLRQQSETGLAKPLPRDTYPYEFGPNIPLTPAPLDPTRRSSGRAEPRLWEYPVGWNLPGTGLGRLVPWRTLRDAANLPLIRDCIRVRKAEIQGLEWDFGLSRRAIDRAQRENPGASRIDVEQELRQRLVGDIDRATDFWSVPDKGNGYTFAEWITQALEEHLVLDALAIYPRYTLGGDLYALEVLDGSTIKPLLDHRGGRPMAPQPAYQQIIHGFPRGEFTADTSDTDGQTVIPAAYTADQLIYIRREVRAFTPYGLSPVEQALYDIDIWQKRLAWIRAEYTDGVMPAGWLINEQTGTTMWTPQQIAEYERALNDYLSGNTANRHRYRVLPPGLRPDDSGSSDRQAEKYKPEFDLHLLKLITAHFDLTIHELGFTEAKGLGSDGHAEGQDRLNERKGRGPVLRWIAELITEMSRAHLGLPRELEFKWLDIEDDDSAAEEEERTVAQVAGGVLTVNEARDQLGRPRFPFPEADKPAVINGATITFLEGAEERQQQQAELEAEVAKAKAQAPVQKPGEKPPAKGDAPKPKPDAKKAAEAAAYRRWAAKGTSSRRFVLEHDWTAAELVEHGVDLSRVSFLGKAEAPDPGAELDRLAAEYVERLRDAALSAVDVEQLAQEWAQARGLDEVPPPEDSAVGEVATAVAAGAAAGGVLAALAWLLAQGLALPEALDEVTRELVRAGYHSGTVTAQAQLEAAGVEHVDQRPAAEVDTEPSTAPQPPAAPAAERAPERAPERAEVRAGERADDDEADDDSPGSALRRLLDDAGITIKSVAAHRFDELAEVLAEAVEKGTSPQQLAKQLRGVLADPRWAETVAVTELARAMSAATQASYERNGILRKSWLLAPDQRVCPTCSANAAQGPISTVDRFTSGDLYPPAHPHCRCALLPVLD